MEQLRHTANKNSNQLTLTVRKTLSVAFSLTIVMKTPVHRSMDRAILTEASGLDGWQ